MSAGSVCDCYSYGMDRVLAVLLLPLVGLATTSSSACTFQLHYQVCLQHGVLNTTRDCDTLTTGLEAEFGASSSVRFHTRGLTWTGGQVDELEATAHLNEGSFKYSGIKENLSGIICLKIFSLVVTLASI